MADGGELAGLASVEKQQTTVAGNVTFISMQCNAKLENSRNQ
jgi:hypothetical protein